MDLALWLTGFIFGVFHSTATEEGIAGEVVLHFCEEAGSRLQLVFFFIQELKRKRVYIQESGSRLVWETGVIEFVE